MERLYSAVAEFEDGRRKVLPVRGESHGSVFQQVKQMPGVRRVGKVAEVSQAAFEALGRGEVPSELASPVPAPATRVAERQSTPAPAQQPPAELSAEERQRILGGVISGPRVVVAARPTGGEQPFRFLKAPPERPKPPVVVEVKAKAPAATAPKPAKPAPAPKQDAAAADGEPEYRILKSRRRDGNPYLLQRGRWQTRGGKRQFEAEWEKDFAERPEAERHLEALRRGEHNTADLDPRAA